ncbi:MAG: hypothetical protein J6568_01145 [Snodgrassella sp.]|nr:hypothetical protein [Snodgrassella sp.]
MTRFKLLLLILGSCTVMFIGWLILASLNWLENKRFIAYICFILAFISVLGQITALAFTLRERLRQHASSTLANPDGGSKTNQTQ